MKTSVHGENQSCLSRTYGMQKLKIIISNIGLKIVRQNINGGDLVDDTVSANGLPNVQCGAAFVELRSIFECAVEDNHRWTVRC